MAGKTFQRTLDSADLRIRSDEQGGPVVLSGYAVRYEDQIVLYDSPNYRVTETIKRGACRTAVESGQDVRFLIDHNSSLLLGRTRAGTLLLRDDPEGLWFEVTLPDTQVARDLAENIRLKNVDQMSFSFIPRSGGESSKTRSESGRAIRDDEYTDLDLYDVSAVTFPAYKNTTIGFKNRSSEFEKAAWLAERSEKFAKIEMGREARKVK